MATNEAIGRCVHFETYAVVIVRVFQAEVRRAAKPRPSPDSEHFLPFPASVNLDSHG